MDLAWARPRREPSCPPYPPRLRLRTICRAFMLGGSLSSRSTRSLGSRFTMQIMSRRCRFMESTAYSPLTNATSGDTRKSKCSFLRDCLVEIQNRARGQRVRGQDGGLDAGRVLQVAFGDQLRRRSLVCLVVRQSLGEASGKDLHL